MEGQREGRGAETEEREEVKQAEEGIEQVVKVRDEEIVRVVKGPTVRLSEAREARSLLGWQTKKRIL